LTAARCGPSRRVVGEWRASSVRDVALAPGTWPRPLLRAIRISNKYLLNPVMGALAGRKNSYAAAIRHTGRKSGKQYSTPVGADRVQDGFIIPLAYGGQVDWLQNVLAAGCATVSAEGETREVTEPEVIDAATALPMLSSRRRRTFERMGIAQYLRVKLA
jgi:deazaflavin-dependent oxidoreductase (nitroreductase family)